MLKSITVHKFRSYDQARVHPSAGLSVLYGNNGIGKTTILEAIAVATTLRSFKTASLTDLKKKESSGVGFVELLFENQSLTSLKVENVEHRKTLWIDGQKIKTPSEFLGKIQVVTLSPENVDLIYGLPEQRRRYLDMLIYAQNPQYYETLTQYKRAQKHKHALLQDNLSFKEYVHLVEVWNHQLMELGQRIREARLNLISQMTERVFEHYRYISNKNHDLTLTYQYDAKLLQTRFKEDAQKEFFAKRLLFGPHRDDILIHLHGMPAKQACSRGELSTLLLALKWSELDLANITKKELNVLFLLDDVGMTLDAERQDFLFTMLQNYQGQILMTTADSQIKDRALSIGGTLYHLERQFEHGIPFARWVLK